MGPAGKNSIYPDALTELAEFSTFVASPIVSSERERLVHQRFVPKTKTIAMPPPLTQPLSLSQRLETLLNLSEKGGRLPLKETINTINILGELYKELKSKKDTETSTDFQYFMMLGKRVVNAILTYSLQPRYFKEYVQLLSYLADIRNMMNRTTDDKMKLFGEYQSFHYQIEYLMQHYILDSSERSKYHHICLQVLRQALKFSQNSLEQKELLSRIIDRGGWILLLKRIIDNSAEVEVLFNSYNQLYWLEEDNKVKLSIIENALSWSKTLRENRKETLSDKIRSSIELYTLQYEKWKKFEESCMLPAISDALENGKEISAQSSFKSPPLGGSFSLPAFKTSADRQMLQRLSLKG